MNLQTAFKEIFVFFFKQEIKSKRTRLFIVFSLLPVIILLFAKISELSAAGDVTAEKVFTRAILITYIQLLVPLLALLFGSSVVNEEVDNKTLVFLTTTPIPRASIILGKFFAYGLLAAIIINLGLFLCFVVLNIDRPGDMLYVKEVFIFSGVSILGTLTYMSLFTLLGTLMKKAGVVLGLMFIFGWENVVQYFPGITQKFTVIHWVKSLLPKISGSQGFQFLMFRLEPSPAVTSIVVLAIFVVAALIAASIVFKNKEYILSENV
jgi:ABC-type transport system involved in multi-copper enzyme maturation permease subunit